MRIFQPPENSDVRRDASRSGAKPSPFITCFASTSKPKPPFASNSRWSLSCSESSGFTASPEAALMRSSQSASRAAMSVSPARSRR